MNLEVVKLAAADNSWATIFPELMLGCIALGLLVLEILLPKKYHAVIPDCALAGLLAVLVGLLINFHSASLGLDTFNGLLHHSLPGQVMRGFFLLSALLVCLLARVSLAQQRMPRVEFYHLVLVITDRKSTRLNSSH